MKHYEELTGGSGRRIYYRAERFKARDLFKRALPDLAIDNIDYALQDISLNGLAALAGRGTNDYSDVGVRVPVQLGVNGTVLHEGVGEISRIEPTPFGTKLGVRLTDRCFNIPQLVAKYQETLIRADLDRDLAQADGLVAPEYRAVCADVVHLLRTYKAIVERFMAAHPDPAAMDEMYALCEKRMLPRWRKLWYRANELVRPLLDEPAAFAAAKRYTELVVTPEFLPGAFIKRAYEKPLGYPGDFQVMQYVYDWQREGRTLYDQLVHRIGLDSAECVASRMVMVRQAIAAVVTAAPDDGPVHIASLGCGPAKEVVDYLQLRTLPKSVRFTLIDQDHAALSLAYERTYAEVLRLGGRATVNCLHTSFSQLLKAGELFHKLPAQNLIYSVGLIDYLVAKRAKSLVAALYEQLAPGGTLIVGNMFDTLKGTFWTMEFICDWNIIYRSEAEMRALAEDLGAAEVTTEIDPTGCVCMMRIRKP